MGPSRRHWRRGRDSNPRYSFGPYTGLANQRLQPLGHLSQPLIPKVSTGGSAGGAEASRSTGEGRQGTEEWALPATGGGRRPEHPIDPGSCIGSGMALPIEDYAIIADCRSVALVGNDGSIDWLCLPRIDSDACFAALLGTPDNGRWLLAPEGGIRRVTRRYRERTLILETDFETEDGAVTVVDLMPISGQGTDLARIVIGKRGKVPMRMQLVIRYGYGAVVPWVRRISDGIEAIGGPDVLRLATPVATHGEGLTTVARFTVGPGDRVPFVLTWSPSHLPDPGHVDAEVALRESEEGWRDWCKHCNVTGPHRDIVQRSLITLKALTYEPTAGVIAAATTSLPEQPGGVRNWDYRICWLRDATFTLYSLMSAGFVSEARAWREWLLRAVAGDPAQLQIMYGVAGERRLPELELDWLPGYQGSPPGRHGN